MIYIILLIALLLRLIVINQSLWLDEAIGALAIKNISYKNLFSNFFTIDNHPPFYYLFLKMWSKLFGYSEFSLRLPSVLFAIGTIFLTYKIAGLIKQNKNERSLKLFSKGRFAKLSLSFPILASFLLAISQFHIYYSQEARMYSMAAFFATLSVYFYILIVNQRIKLQYFIGFSISIFFLGITDYVPYFLIFTLVLYSLVKIRDKNLSVKFTITFLPLIAFWILWLPLFTKQSQGGNWLLVTLPAWKKLAGGANIKQILLLWIKFTIGRITFINKYIYAIVVAFSSIVYFIPLKTFYKNKINDKFKIIFLWFIGPLVLSFLTSFFIPSFIYFRFLFIYPAFVLLLSWGILNIKNNKIKIFVFWVVTAISILSGFYYYLDKNLQREDWRGAVSYIENNLKTGDVVIFEYPEPFAPYRWYQKIPGIVYGATDSISANNDLTKNKTLNLINSKTGVYYFEYLHDLSDPADYVRETLITQGFRIEEIKNYYGVGQLYYYVRQRL